MYDVAFNNDDVILGLELLAKARGQMKPNEMAQELRHEYDGGNNVVNTVLVVQEQA